MDIFPDKKELVALGNTFDKFRAEIAGNNTFLMVVDTAAGWIPNHLPAPLPGTISEINIFPVEGFVEQVHPPEL